MDEKTYIPAESLFPNWKEAKTVLTQFCEQTKWWQVKFDLENQKLNINLQFPIIKDESTGDMVPFMIKFPDEYRHMIFTIVSKLCGEYIPDLSDFAECEPGKEAEDGILEAIKKREEFIVFHGGKPIFDELKFRLGVM